MRGAVGRYTIFFVALGLVLWAYQTKMQPPPEGPELPDHPLILAKLESEELLNDGLKIARALLIQDGDDSGAPGKAGGLGLHVAVSMPAATRPPTKRDGSSRCRVRIRVQAQSEIA